MRYSSPYRCSFGRILFVCVVIQQIANPLHENQNSDQPAKASHCESEGPVSEPGTHHSVDGAPNARLIALVLAITF